MSGKMSRLHLSIWDGLSFQLRRSPRSRFGVAPRLGILQLLCWVIAKRKGEKTTNGTGRAERRGCVGGGGRRCRSRTPARGRTPRGCGGHRRRRPSRDRPVGDSPSATPPEGPSAVPALAAAAASGTPPAGTPLAFVPSPQSHSTFSQACSPRPRCRTANLLHLELLVGVADPRVLE